MAARTRLLTVSLVEAIPLVVTTPPFLRTVTAAMAPMAVVGLAQQQAIVATAVVLVATAVVLVATAVVLVAMAVVLVAMAAVPVATVAVPVATVAVPVLMVVQRVPMVVPTAQNMRLLRAMGILHPVSVSY
jgi:hypothetical protein